MANKNLDVSVKTTFLTPPTGAFIRVLGWSLACVTTGNVVTIEDATGTVYHTAGGCSVAGNTDKAIPIYHDSYFDLPANTALVINTAQRVTGSVQYAFFQPAS